MSAAKKWSGFACLECGHKFRTVKAAESARFGSDGCPKCGGADIDLLDADVAHENDDAGSARLVNTLDAVDEALAALDDDAEQAKFDAWRDGGGR